MEAKPLVLALMPVFLGLVACAGDVARDRPLEENKMIETMYINSELVDCEGASGAQQCMQVRRGPEEPWELFYDQIEGFVFEPGFVYELRVETSGVDDPPADSSSLHYELVEVVNRSRA